MVLPILTVPSQILRTKSQPIAKVDKKVLEFIANLEETLLKKKNPQGVGLSAPQIGKNWRIFSTLLPKDKPVIQTFINPVIVKVSKKLILGNEKHKLRATSHEPILEGCLSIPGIYGPVYRHEWIKLKWLVASGQWLVAKFSGFTARVMQHELDHLDGILFTDRAIAQKLPLYEDKNGKMLEISLS